MKVRTPEGYCQDYFKAVYGSHLESVPVPTGQQLEVALAFHAGLEAAFKFIDEFVTKDETTSEERLVARLQHFRDRNKERATHLNRRGGYAS